MEIHTSVSPPQTSCKFSCFTKSKLQRACKISNNCVTIGLFRTRTHFRYSFTSQIAHIAPDSKEINIKIGHFFSQKFSEEFSQTIEIENFE